MYGERKEISRSFVDRRASTTPIDLWFQARAQEIPCVDFSRLPSGELPKQRLSYRFGAVRDVRERDSPGTLSANNTLHRALGRIAELLVAESARVGLDEGRDRLEELRREPYRERYEDGRTQQDEEEKEAAERGRQLFDADYGSWQ